MLGSTVSFSMVAPVVPYNLKAPCSFKKSPPLEFMSLSFLSPSSVTGALLRSALARWYHHRNVYSQVPGCIVVYAFFKMHSFSIWSLSVHGECFPRDFALFSHFTHRDFNFQTHLLPWHPLLLTAWFLRLELNLRSLAHSIDSWCLSRKYPSLLISAVLLLSKSL